MFRTLSLAGFQVTLIGRFWVTPEAQVGCFPRVQENLYSSLPIALHGVLCMAMTETAAPPISGAASLKAS
jgi:hypothetical protein